MLAALYDELGRELECASAFETLAADDFAALPRDEEWLYGMTLLAPVCASLGDERRAELLYGLLAPYGDRNALSVPDVAAGSVARSLGVLAAATGRREEASGHYEDALAMNERIGALPWLARTRHDYGRMLQGPRCGQGRRTAARRGRPVPHAGHDQLGAAGRSGRLRSLRR